MKKVYYKSASRRYYKASATRTPVLLFLLTVTIILFAITELAIRHIPSHEGYGKVGDAVTHVLDKKALLRRENVLAKEHPTTVPAASSFQLHPEGPEGMSSGAGSTVLGNSYLSGPCLTRRSPIATSMVSPSHIQGDVPKSTPRNEQPALPTTPPVTPTIGEETGPSYDMPLIASTPNDSLYLTIPDPSPTSPPDGSQTTINLVPDGRRITVGPGNSETPGPNPSTSKSIAFATPGPRITPGPGGLKPSIPGQNPAETIFTFSTDGQYLQPGVEPETLTPIPIGTGLYSKPGVNPGKEAGNTQGAVSGLLPNPIQELPVLTVLDGQTFAVTPAYTVINGATYTQMPILTVVDGKTYAVTPYVTVNNGKTYTTTPGAPASGSLKDKTNSASRPTATIVNSTGTYYTWSNGETHLAPNITLREYILVAFVPLIVSVLYTIPWLILHVTICEMEPFYQLSRKGGALGRDSLCLDYSTSWLITTPFKAISRGHFMPFWSSLISIAVLILAPVSSEAFFVSVSGECGSASKDDHCRAAWGVYPILGRVIQGILAFIAVLVILIGIFNYRRPSGVYSEPLSLAGLGVLLAKSPLLKCLRQIDSMTTSKELRKSIQGKRFAIASFVGEDRTPCRGIVPMDMDSEVGVVPVGNVREKVTYASVRNVDESGIGEFETQQNPHRGIIKWHSGISFWKDVQEKLLYVGAFLVIGGLLTVITYYHWTGPDPVTGKTTGFETFMDSQGYGVRFMMSSLGVAIKLLWSDVDYDLRRATPFTSLIRGSSKPNNSILVPFYGSPTTAIIPSLKRKHFIVAWVAFLAFLSEFLPIFLANIPYSPAMTKDAYTYCHFLAMAILILMLLALLVLLFRKPGGVGSLPRRPGEGGLINTAMYLAAPSEADSTFSNVFGRESEKERGLLDCLAGLSLLRGSERDDSIVGVGSLYSLGVVDGGDDERSIGVRRRSAGDLREELRIDDDRRVRRLLCE